MLSQSESVELLASALAEAQKAMPSVSKDKTNPFFKSLYADLASVIQTVAPVITLHGLSVTQFPDFDGVHDLLTTRLLHSSGQWLEASMRLMPIKNDPQNQGSALTYGKRYAYCAVLGIVADTDDDGNAASRPAASSAPARSSQEQGEPARTTRVSAPKAAAAKPPTSDEKPAVNMRKLFAMLSGIGVGEDERHAWAATALGAEVTSFSQLTAEDVSLLEKAAKEQQMSKAKSSSSEDDDASRPF